jgi:hypothetical protein
MVIWQPLISPKRSDPASYGAIYCCPWQEADTIKAAIGAFFLTIAGV